MGARQRKRSTPREVRSRLKSKMENLSPNRRARFLKEYARCGVVTAACRSVAVGRRTVYDWVDRDAEFRAAFEEAREEATDTLEREARRRAVHGVLEPVFYEGQRIAFVRKYSDTLLLALLNAYRPDRFKYRHEHAGPDGGPLQVGHVVLHLPDNSRDPELTKRAELKPALPPARESREDAGCN